MDYETIYEFLVDDSEMEVISGHQELPSYVEKVLETMKKCFNFSLAANLVAIFSAFLGVCAALLRSTTCLKIVTNQKKKTKSQKFNQQSDANVISVCGEWRRRAPPAPSSTSSER